MSTDNKTKSTAERAEIDPVFKEVLTFNFRRFSIPLQTQVEVSRLPRTMDALVVLEPSEAKEKVLRETAFNYFRAHNQIEFKGKADPLTRAGYRLILGRTNLYLGEKDLSANEMTVTIISARQPRKVLYLTQEDVRWEAIGGGHYVSTDILPVHLFVCNELVIEPKNYPLLLFAASKQKFRQFISRLVAEDNAIYIYYASRVEPQTTKEVLKMAGKQSLYEKQLQRIAESMGEDLIPFLSEDEKSLKQIAESMGEDLIPFLSEEVVERIPPEKRVRGLTAEDIVRSLSPEIKEKLRQLLKPQDGKQN